MPYVADDLLQRIEAAVDRTIQLALALPRNIAGQEIGRQVIRSAGGAGANLEEGKAVLSRKDYTYKVSLSLRDSARDAFLDQAGGAKRIASRLSIEGIEHGMARNRRHTDQHGEEAAQVSFSFSLLTSHLSLDAVLG